MAWVEGRVLERIEWTPTLFSLRVAVELAPTRRAIHQTGPRAGRSPRSAGLLLRQSPVSPYHEFYFVEIPDGELTPSSVRCKRATACWCNPWRPVF